MFCIKPIPWQTLTAARQKRPTEESMDLFTETPGSCPSLKKDSLEEVFSAKGKVMILSRMKKSQKSLEQHGSQARGSFIKYLVRPGIREAEVGKSSQVQGLGYTVNQTVRLFQNSTHLQGRQVSAFKGFRV